jgi:hypothetical protein
MATRGFKEHMSAFQERMFLTPPRPEDRLKPWTTADIAKFAGANPKAAADMQTLRSAGLVSGLGGLVGGGAGAAFFFSRPGTINGKLFSAALGCPPCLHPPALGAQRPLLFLAPPSRPFSDRMQRAMVTVECHSLLAAVRSVLALASALLCASADMARRLRGQRTGRIPANDQHYLLHPRHLQDRLESHQ